MSAGRAHAAVGGCLATAALLAAGCSLSMGGGGYDGPPPEPDVGIWVPSLVRWEAGADRHVDLAIENPTDRTIAIAAPDPANAGVAIFRGPDTTRACGVEPRPAGEARAGAARKVMLGPGERISVRVDLGKACAGLGPGEYRYEIAYRAPPVAGEDAFSGALATRFGELVVAEPPQASEGDRPVPRRAARAPPHR